MIVYHFAWDLGLFNIVDPVIVNSGRWKLFAVSIGSSFLFLSGISFWLASYEMVLILKNLLKRFLILVAAALIVSLGTYQANSHTFVFFGILHLLSVCTLLGLLIYKMPSDCNFNNRLSIIIFEPYLISEFYKPKYLAWTGLYLWFYWFCRFLWIYSMVQCLYFWYWFSKIIFKIKRAIFD